MAAEARALLILMFSLVPALSACDGASAAAPAAAPPRVVAVAAASDLRYALDELIAAFAQQHPDILVRPTYGSSGNLYAQLRNRAPFDLFLSADIEYPRMLIESGDAVAASALTYGVGRIVVWVSSASPLDLDRLGIEALADPSVRKVAIANPAHAPYGRAAEAAMRSLGVYERVRERLVLGDNIAQAAQFVDSGAADAGVIALALALSPAMRERGRFWEVPPDAYPRMEQGGVILTRAQDHRAAELFRAFMLSPEGRAVLRRYGFDDATADR